MRRKHYTCITILVMVALIARSVIYIYQPSTPSSGSMTYFEEEAPVNDTMGAFQRLAKYLHRVDDVETVQHMREILVKDKHIHQMINDIIAEDGDFFPNWFWTATMDTLVKSLSRKDYGAVLVDFTNNQTQENATEGWGELDRVVRQYSVYNPNDPALKELLQRMAHSEIERIRANNVGWHLKVDVKLKDGGWAVLKPMRLPRYLRLKSKYERHHSEIAAFHLDRLLGYYRVPPTVGRFVNLQTELFPLLQEGIRNTFFVNEGNGRTWINSFSAIGRYLHQLDKIDGRTCFYGDCYKCSKNETFCGDPEIAEMSLMYYLPGIGKRKDFYNEWLFKRKHANPDGKSESMLCNDTRVESLNGNRLVLDVLDVRYFDALTDNYDRHHYAAYTVFDNDTIPLLYDNSEGFRGRFSSGVLDSATKRGTHCCLMKKSTFLKYLKLYLGPAHLSDLMRQSLRADPFNPVLTEDQLTALDRRVYMMIFFMHECLKNAHHISHVIVDDIT